MKWTARVFVVLILCSMMVVSAHGEQPMISDQADLNSRARAEIQRAILYGIVPEKLQRDYEKTISYAEYCDLIRNMLTLHDASLLPIWEPRVAAASVNNNALLRVDGCMALFYAMQAMQCQEPTAIDMQVGNFWEADYTKEARDTMNSIDYGDSPFRDHYDRIDWFHSQQSMVEAAVFTCMAKRSHISYEACYDYKIPLDQPLTRVDAILSVVRLYETDDRLALAYLTELQQALLQSTSDPAEAAELRAAILGSDTTIEKAETFVKGQTYTGTAYYVSQSGNDKNDGRRPDRAWASLARVNKARLKKGDIVFFERGGLFRGALHAYTPGVTYSAYGKGAKPILTSALDGSGAERWTLHYEAADGRRIWAFADPIPDCGIIVLDGSYQTRPYKVMPDWSGKGFVNHDDQSPFSVERGLKRDLDFFSDAFNTYPAELSFSVTDRPVSTGTLYLRCDAGNPGEVYKTIELGAAYSFQNYSSYVVGMVEDCVLDNLCLVNSGGVGVSYGPEGWLVQNCDISGCGGTILSYDNGLPVMRGEAFCGSYSKDGVVRNNWVHDNPSGINLEEYQDTDRIAVDGFVITGNLFERNDCDINFQHNNYEADTFGTLRGIAIRDNLFLYTGGGQNTLDIIRSGTDEVFGGTAWSRCISINQPMYTQDCLVMNNAFYYPLHGVFVSTLEEDHVPVIYGNRFYPARQSEAFAIWKVDGRYTYYSWIDWTQAEEFLSGYLGAANLIVRP